MPAGRHSRPYGSEPDVRPRGVSLVPGTAAVPAASQAEERPGRPRSQEGAHPARPRLPYFRASPKSAGRRRQALWMWLAGFFALSAWTFRNSTTNPAPRAWYVYPTPGSIDPP